MVCRISKSPCFFFFHAVHALKLLEVCIFQVENRVPGVISNAVNLAYERGFGQIAIQRDVKTSELRTMCVQVIMAGLYTDQTQETLREATYFK